MTNEEILRAKISQILIDFDDFRETPLDSFVDDIIESIKANPFDAMVMQGVPSADILLAEIEEKLKYFDVPKNKREIITISVVKRILSRVHKIWLNQPSK